MIYEIDFQFHLTTLPVVKSSSIGHKTISFGLLPESTNVWRNFLPRKFLCSKGMTDCAASIVPFSDPSPRRQLRLQPFPIVMTRGGITR